MIKKENKNGKNENINIHEQLGEKIPEIPKIPVITKEISNPVLIGLLNIGATCYMNTTLQCSSHVDRLVNYLLDDKTYKELEKEKKTTKRLAFSFAEVLKNLWKILSQKYYASEYFKEVICDMNPIFKGIAANDSKDLIIFMLENIHKELNTKQINSNNIINSPEPNPCDFNAVYIDFINHYKKYNESIITKEFYGFNNTMATCNNCYNSIHNVQAYNILFFPLEEVRKYKNYNINKVSKIDCFDHSQKKDFFPSFFCNICNHNSSANSQSILVDTPKTLIINLN